MTLPVAFWVPGRPASFRNVRDATWWKEYVQDAVVEEQAWAQLLLGPPADAAPSQAALSLEVLHLYIDGTLRDVDNTAKPLMDAFNKRLYNDDKQVRQLTFRSLRFDCEAAHLALQSNEIFRSFLRSAVNQANRGGHLIEDLTFVAFREMNVSLNEPATGVAAAGLTWVQVRDAFLK